jgi:hypothetical protein
VTFAVDSDVERERVSFQAVGVAPGRPFISERVSFETVGSGRMPFQAVGSGAIDVMREGLQRALLICCWH